jgi:hypothetical protein
VGRVNAAPTRKQWEELAAAALIGSDRAGQRKPAEILVQAGVIGTMRRAGYAPRSGAPDAAPTEPESLPLCSPSAAAMLSRILKDNDVRLAEEWCSLAAAAGRLAPPSLLPDLFDACARSVPLREPARGCAGARGRWLAPQRPEWAALHAPAALEDYSTEWPTATGPQRREWLTTVRRREPALALGLLRSTWATDSADERKRFIELLAINLSPGDEEFLESAMQDRSKLVRQAAAGLLSTMPGSAYVRRMAERGAGLLRAAGGKGLLKKPRVAVFPPEAWDAALEKEGLDEKPPAGTGKRAWWLRQILGVIPPAHWSQKLALAPEQLIAGLEDSDYRDDVIDAWLAAAPRFGDSDWCAALAATFTAKKKGGDDHLPRLWEPLPPVQREEVLLQIIRKIDARWERHWQHAASADHRWSAPFSRAVVAALARQIPPKPPEWYHIGPAVEELTYAVHPAAAADLERAIDSLFKSDPPPSIGAAIERLRLRVEMHKEFAS